jgi:predicted RNase H-like HicB family nuclease
MSKHLTAIVQAERPGFVALCPEIDVASQGETIEESLANLREAVELFYECASPEEILAKRERRGLRHAARGFRWVSFEFFPARPCARYLSGMIPRRSGDAAATS